MFIVVETRCIASLRAERNNRMTLQPAYHVYNSGTTIAPDIPTKAECTEGRRLSAAVKPRCIEAPTGHFDTIFAMQKSLNDLQTSA